MGQVQSQPQVQQPWSIWSLLGGPTNPVVNPGPYAPMVYMTQAPVQGLTIAPKAANVKVNVKPNIAANKNKNKATAILEAPMLNKPSTPVNFAVANAQTASQPASGGRRGKKKTRRARK